MSCRNPEISEQILAYIDGVLPAEDADLFSAHVASCPWCRQEIESLEGFSAQVRGAFRQQRAWPFAALCPAPDDLIDLAADALPESRRQPLRAHLEICPACRDQVAMLRELEAEPAPPAADAVAAPPMSEAVRQAFAAANSGPVASRTAGGRWTAFTRWTALSRRPLAAVASVAVLIGLTLLLAGHPPQLMRAPSPEPPTAAVPALSVAQGPPPPAKPPGSAQGGASAPAGRPAAVSAPRMRPLPAPVEPAVLPAADKVEEREARDAAPPGPPPRPASAPRGARPTPAKDVFHASAPAAAPRAAARAAASRAPAPVPPPPATAHADTPEAAPPASVPRAAVHAVAPRLAAKKAAVATRSAAPEQLAASGIGRARVGDERKPAAENEMRAASARREGAHAPVQAAKRRTEDRLPAPTDAGGGAGKQGGIPPPGSGGAYPPGGSVAPELQVASDQAANVPVLRPVPAEKSAAASRRLERVRPASYGTVATSSPAHASGPVATAAGRFAKRAEAPPPAAPSSYVRSVQRTAREVAASALGSRDVTVVVRVMPLSARSAAEVRSLRVTVRLNRAVSPHAETVLRRALVHALPLRPQRGDAVVILAP